MPGFEAADEFGQSYLAAAFEAFGEEDGLDGFDGLVEVAIDDDVIIFGPVAHFVGGFGHAAVDFGGVVLGAREEAALEFVPGGREDEDADEIVARFFRQLLGALPVDIEQNIAALGEGFFDGQARGSVIIAENLGMFEQLVAVDEEVEFGRVDEAVVFAIDLARAGGAGGDGDG